MKMRYFGWRSSVFSKRFVSDVRRSLKGVTSVNLLEVCLGKGEKVVSEPS